VVIAGTHSGVGKTTVATGLMAAFRARGARVGAAKVGPDFIDPGYHTLATGRPSRNLDAWMCGEDAVAGLAGRAAEGCDLLVIEGVMGLFDGSGERDPASVQPRAMVASTAHVALLTGAPVILVVDAASMSGSVAALVHGFATFDSAVRLSGVVLNRVASDRHEAMLRDALADSGVPVLGVLRRDPGLGWRDRHLGLVPVVEHPAEVRRSLDRLAAAIASGCDLAAIERVAHAAPAVHVTAPASARRVVEHAVPIAIAAGPAFSFAYPDNAEALEAAGADLLPFDPLHDPSLPAGAQGLVAGGGFPEVFAARLAANRPLLDDVRAKVGAGLVTWAECGGLLWLSRTLDGEPMAGVLPCDARMTDRLTLGYRRAMTSSGSPLCPAGTEVRGHEFHYSETEPPGEGLRPVGGYVSPILVASYLHLHLGAAPSVAERFVATCGAASAGVRPPPR